MSKDFTPLRPPDHSSVKNFMEWWVDAVREGQKIEAWPCDKYCKTKAKTDEAYQQCWKFCAETQDFARWHDMN